VLGDGGCLPRAGDAIRGLSASCVKRVVDRSGDKLSGLLRSDIDGERGTSNLEGVCRRPGSSGTSDIGFGLSWESTNASKASARASSAKTSTSSPYISSDRSSSRASRAPFFNSTDAAGVTGAMTSGSAARCPTASSELSLDATRGSPSDTAFASGETSSTVTGSPSNAVGEAQGQS